MKKTTRSPTSRSGTQAGTSGIGSRGRNSSWEMRAKGRTTMKSRVPAILLLVCSLGIAAGVIYADLKEGYYSPAELGIIRQAAPIEFLPDANYQVSSYPFPPADITPGDGLQDLHIHCI